MRSFLHRWFDIAGALLGVVAVAPLLGVLAVAVKLESRGPVFRAYPLLGLNGRMFTSYKFRSEDERGRLTRFGLFLRRSSLDELPLLLNVLRGAMSLVGPQPLAPEEGEYGSAALRLVVRPGLSGAVQASRQRWRHARTPSPEPARGADIIDRGKALHLLGESVRDIGILVAVFAPLDAYFQAQRARTWSLVLIEVGALCFVGIGIVLESLTVQQRK